MSMSELAKLGGGKVAYIKMITSDQAKEMFPAIEGLPAGINLFALHAADGDFHGGQERRHRGARGPRRQPPADAHVLHDIGLGPAAAPSPREPARAPGSGGRPVPHQPEAGQQVEGAKVKVPMPAGPSTIAGGQAQCRMAPQRRRGLRATMATKPGAGARRLAAGHAHEGFPPRDGC